MIVALTAAALVQAQPAAARVEDLAWMAGRWESGSGESWTEEIWAAPRGGMIIGLSRSGQGERLGGFEFLRIEATDDGVATYVAQPGGGAPVGFRLVAREGTSAVFENRAHDYPQRIHYLRSGDRMTATVSLADGSRPMSWSFRLAR